MIRRPYRPLRVRPIRAPGTGRIHVPGVHPFGPGGPSGGALYPCRPGFRPQGFRRPGVLPPPGFRRPRVSPWAMVHRAYSPAGYVHSPRRGALYPCRPGFRPGLWSTGPTARPGTGERPVGAPDHSQGRNPWAARSIFHFDVLCTSSSCFCLRILVRLRGQRSIRKTCVSIRNITYFISPVHMAGMFILQAPYLLPISAVCFPRCSRNPRTVNNPSRRN